MRTIDVVISGWCRCTVNAGNDVDVGDIFFGRRGSAARAKPRETF